MSPFPENRESEGNDLPLAPFLDIIFILLIFVLVSTRMVDENLLPVDLASSSKPSTSESDRPSIAIHLESDHVLIPSLNVKTDLDNLSGLLQEQCSRQPIFKVRTSGQIPLQRFVDLSDALMNCGSLQLVVRKEK